MVAANDQMRAAIVLANDGMPQGFAGPGHTHGKVEQAQRGGLFRVLFQDVLVAADAREVIYVARFGHANHRMDQQIGLDFTGCAEGQFPVCAVQWVAGLEGDYLAPAQLAEAAAQF